MKEISKQIIHFLDSTVSSKLLHTPHIHLSHEATTMLATIFHKIKEAEDVFEKAVIQEKWINFEHTKIPRGVDYHYSPEMARSEIEKIAKFGCIFTFKIGTREIQVSIIFEKTTQNNTRYCNDSLKRIFMWLYLSTHYASTQCSRRLNIYLYLTELKKTLPSLHEHIKQEHANSGFTTTCSTISEIHIYREEEWFKVLIHETFHNMGLDFSGMDNSQINKCILSIFPIKTTEKCFFESYCEMWAEIINVMFISFLSTKTRTIDELIKKTKRMLKKEQEFSLFQCVKVLCNFGLGYEDLYSTTPQAQHARLYKYKEKTPIFAYFVLKSMMMFFVGDYIHWCAIHNQGSLQFSHFDKNLIDYCGFIREHYQRQEYLQSIKLLETWFNRHCKKIDNVKMLQTLRMSVHEF